jgi:hypothetical protein
VKKRTVHRAIILVLVAAGCVMVVPGVSDAHVRAQRRAEYKTTLNGLKSTFNVYARAYDSAKSASEQWATNIAATSDQDLRITYEQQALGVYTANVGLPMQWNLSYARAVKAFKAKAPRYFAAVKQQSRFKTACDRLKANAGVLIQSANEHVYDSFKELGTDPPDYVTSAAMIGFGDESAASGHEGFDKQMAALKALE